MHVVGDYRWDLLYTASTGGVPLHTANGCQMSVYSKQKSSTYCIQQACMTCYCIQPAGMRHLYCQHAQSTSFIQYALCTRCIHKASVRLWQACVATSCAVIPYWAPAVYRNTPRTPALYGASDECQSHIRQACHSQICWAPTVYSKLLNAYCT